MKTTILILFLVIIFKAFSQNTKIDSLQQEVNKAKGTNRILQLNELAYTYWDIDSKKSISVGNQALRLAEQYKFNKAKARTYNIISWAYFLLDNFHTADKYCDSSLVVSKSYGTDLDRMKSLRNKTSFYAQGYTSKNYSIKTCLNELLELSHKKRDYERFEDAASNIIIHNAVYKINDFNTIGYLDSLLLKADENLKPTLYLLYGYYYESNLQHFKSIEMLKKALIFKNDRVRFQSYIILGSIYNDLNRFKESNKYLLEALTINLDSGDLLTLYFNLAAVNIGLEDYKQAYKYAMAYNKLTGNGYKLYKESEWRLCNNFGRIYLGLDSLKKAVFYINRALLLSDSLSPKEFKLIALQTKFKLLKKQSGNKNLGETVGAIAQIIDSVKDVQITYEGYRQLTDYYESTGDYKKSLHYLEKWVVVSDSLKSRESLQVFNEFQTKYETKNKEHQISTQQSIISQKDKLIVFVVIAGSLLFAALFVIFILYQIRNKAYKLLVYQNAGNIGKAQLVKTEDNTIEEDSIEIKNGSSPLDEELKKQIEISLNKQLNIKVYLESNLILKTLAEKCNTNRSYLSQFINEKYTMNFNTFINELRINEAKLILANKSTQIPLKELYLKLGYHSYSVFNDAFKKHVGVTPAFYLKTINSLFDVSNQN